MLAGLLLALIGVADIVRARSGARSRSTGRIGRNGKTGIAIAVLWIGLVAVAWYGLGIAPGIVLGVAAAAGLWMASTTAVGAAVVASTPEPPAARETTSGFAGGEISRPAVRRGPERWPLRRSGSGSWPSILLAVVVVGLFVAGPGVAASATGFVVDWHRASGFAFIDALPLAALVGGVGSALFLIDSANIVVTSALPSGVAVAPGSNEAADSAPGRMPHGVAGETDTASGGGAGGAAIHADRGHSQRWWRLWIPGARTPVRVERGRPGGVPASADSEPAGVADSPTRELKGGRLIGPIERLLLAGFALTGAFPVVAALIAAKGIVRFPEISRATTGNPAEYFLIGSLVSWATAFALAGMCWLLALA